MLPAYCASGLDAKEQGTGGNACKRDLGGSPSNETEVQDVQEVQMEIQVLTLEEQHYQIVVVVEVVGTTIYQ